MGQSHLLLRLLLPALMSLLSGILLTPSNAGADGWPVSHANPANSGWVDVETSSARTPAITRGGLGTFADGYAPVVAPDGTFMLANEQGKVMQFDANGNLRWERQLNGGFGAQSTPAIASNGNIYVLASRTVNDHTVNPSVIRVEVEITGFSPGGAWLFHFPIPGIVGAIPTAPLNIMRAPNGAELIVFPIMYRPPDTTALISHLFAFSLSGGREAEVTVTSLVNPIEGGYMSLGMGFDLKFEEHPYQLHRFKTPLPGVAVMPNDRSSVVINDGINSVVRYQFDGTTFREVWRNKKVLAISSPAIDMLGVPFALENSRYLEFNEVGDLKATGNIGASPIAPTLLPNGALISVNRGGGVSAARIPGVGNYYAAFESESGVPAAASRNFIYIAAKYGLLSFRADNYQLVDTYRWQNGGRVAPVIGPGGHIYAIADNKLHIFLPDTGPANRNNALSGGVVGQADGGNAGGGTITKPIKKTFDPAILVSPGTAMNGGDTPPAADGGTPPTDAVQETTLPKRQRFDPPLTPTGKPLSACVDDKFRDCGKSAARAFCQSMGFAKASDIDVDSKKIQAETLGGAVCTANKCKVLAKVTCSR